MCGPKVSISVLQWKQQADDHPVRLPYDVCRCYAAVQVAPPRSPGLCHPGHTDADNALKNGGFIRKPSQHTTCRRHAVVEFLWVTASRTTQVEKQARRWRRQLQTLPSRDINVDNDQDVSASPGSKITVDAGDGEGDPRAKSTGRGTCIL